MKRLDANDILRRDGPEGLRQRFDQAAARERDTRRNGDANRPIIRISGGTLDQTATEGEDALLASGVPVFQRSNRLVRPILREVSAAHGRKTRVPQLFPIDSIYLRDLLCRVATWEKWDERGKEWRPINPPAEIADTILARVGEWRFPVIAGVIATPTMREDGTILSQEGYDEATRLLLIALPKMPLIPESPTRAAAMAALKLLKNLLVEFPFVADVDRAVALSALIAPVVRGAFPVAPMHCAKAPDAGSGKSYLFDVAAAIAIGHEMPVIGAGADEELEKHLSAALLTGQPLICLDNVNRPLKGEVLSKAIERPLVEIRIFGKLKTVEVESRMTLFSTGNNIVIVGELCRRTVTAALDPKMERPETREFRGDPVETVLANRGEYIAPALTICRAYIALGRPNRAKRLASFEGWSDTVRSSLIWLGEADVCDSIVQARAEDPERAELNEMLSTWGKILGVGQNYRFTLAEVIQMAEEESPQLKSAIQNIARGGAEVDTKKLGYWLRSRKGKVVENYRFMKKGTKQIYWWVEDSKGKEIKNGELEKSPREVDSEDKGSDPESRLAPSGKNAKTT